MNRKAFLAGVAALSAMVGVSQADTVQIALVIDASGSIDDTQYDLQKGAYNAAVTDPAVIPLDGSVTISIWQFAATVQQVFPLTTINDAGDIAALSAAITGMSRAGLGALTALGEAIEAAALDIIGSAFVTDRRVIDVSTDGIETVNGIPQAPEAADAAILGGITQVNGLGIGAGADLSWVPDDISGSFKVTDVTFAGLEVALKDKIVRELVPDNGTTALLLGGGLLGLAALRRRLA